MSLLYEKILKCYSKPMLFYRLTNTQTKDNISATQHKLQYDTGVAIQDNAAQHWWYSRVLTASTISNTGKLSKMVHLDSFSEEPSSLRL